MDRPACCLNLDRTMGPLPIEKIKLPLPTYRGLDPIALLRLPVYCSTMKNTLLSTLVKPTTTSYLNSPAATPSKVTGNTLRASRNEVAKKAYFMYINQGRPQGLDIHHWLKAEAEVEAYQGSRRATVSAAILSTL